jgi:hypothetical protein
MHLIGRIFDILDRYYFDFIILCLFNCEVPEIHLYSRLCTPYNKMSYLVRDCNIVGRLRWPLFAQMIQASGLVKINGNNLVGTIRLDSFGMSLKWSNIGNLRMYLIQVCKKIE